VLGLLGGIASGVVNATRRNDFATYRLAGTSPSDLTRLIFFESVLLGGIVATISLATYGMFSVATSRADFLPLWASFAMACAWVATSMAASFWPMLADPARMAKDR
jgi:hypothetical protein